MKSAMDYEDYADRSKIVEIHIPQVSICLQKHLNAQSVRIFDMGVSIGALQFRCLWYLLL